MSDPRNFFLQMREKLSRQPSRAFDREFWAKFDREFTPPAAAPWAWLLRVALPAGAALALSLFVVYRGGTPPTRGAQAMREMVENAPALADKDMTLFLVGEKKGAGVEPAELLDLSEEDWKLLLREEHG